MRWEDRAESSNVEDRRGMKTAGLALGGGGGILVLLLALVFGVDPKQIGGLGLQPGDKSNARKTMLPEEERMARFAKVVFHDTEEVWSELFEREYREPYAKPKLVLFTGSVDSGCGPADAGVGPFYCPAPGDNKVYIDLSFFVELDKRYGAPGEFARAYVIAHEVGHHVQNLLGYSKMSQQLKSREGKAASVRLELQADYLAGAFAHHAEKKYRMLESGDIESALRAAEAIGDDTLQKKARRPINVDSFTHGSSRQRVKYFSEGLRSGDVSRDRLNYFFSRSFPLRE